MPAKDELTQRQLRFVDEFLVDLNGTRAAIRAGYAESGAHVQASQLLRNPKVRAEIDARNEDVMARLGVTRFGIISELAKIGFANMGHYIRVVDGDPVVDLSNCTPEQLAAVGEVTVEDFLDGRGDNAREVRKVKFKLLDKKGALVDLGRHLGMFVDKVEHTHEVSFVALVREALQIKPKEPEQIEQK